MADNATKTAHVLKRWANAVQRIESLKREINSAECELMNAVDAVGDLLCPKDAAVGETFSIWVNGDAAGRPGDQLLMVTKGERKYAVEWRKHGERNA